MDLRPILDVRPEERRAAALSFLCFFCLLAGYSALRPIRETYGIEGGVDILPLLWTGTFTVSLVLYPALGALASRTTRTRFAAYVLAFIAASLIVFRLLLTSALPPVYLARAFYIWVSVFNLILVSVFWGAMADIFSNEQGRRLFGVIAAGGTAGAVAGPFATRVLVQTVGVEGMLLVSAGLIGLALLCIAGLGRGGQSGAGSGAAPDSVIGGKVLAGLTNVARSSYLLTICASILLLTATATILYLEQLRIVERAIASRAERTEFFANVDLAAQALTLVVQLFLTRRLVRWVGVTGLLVAVPLVTGLGFAALAVAPTLTTLAVFQTMRRGSENGLGRPGREILFTVVPRQDKFKAKNVIDVVVYRGADIAWGWLDIGLRAAGLGVTAMALGVLPFCIVWMAVSVALGRMEERRRAA